LLAEPLEIFKQKQFSTLIPKSSYFIVNIYFVFPFVTSFSLFPDSFFLSIFLSLTSSPYNQCTNTHLPSQRAFSVLVFQRMVQFSGYNSNGAVVFDCIIL